MKERASGSFQSGLRCSQGAAALPALVLLGAATTAGAEPFVGQFELKNLESAPGRFEFQSQNAWSRGYPSRQVVAEPDGLVFDENAIVRRRHALELDAGLTRTLKMRVGIEFEEERLDDPQTLSRMNDFGALSLSELGVELIAVLAAREGDGAGFGVVAELERPMDREESNSLILGPIFELRSGRWFLAAIPMVVYAFGGDAEEGERIDDKWDFAYATQLSYTFSERWMLALEGYGTVERLGRSGSPSESARLFGDFNQHRLGPVLYYTHRLGASRRGARIAREAGELTVDEDDEGTTLTIGLGLLEGLNRDTPDHTLKLSIEVDF